MTIASIDFYANKELLYRMPQLYHSSWYHAPLTMTNFLLNLGIAVFEGAAIIGFLILYTGVDVISDAGKNMVRSINCFLVDYKFFIYRSSCIHHSGNRG